jgi:hypothetical protein
VRHSVERRWALQALSYAEEFRLNRSLLSSVTASSYVLSGLCMSLIAFTAWSRDLVPIFASLTLVKASTFPLLDQCVLLVVLLTAAAVLVPRLLVRKVVKMTLSAEDYLRQSPGYNPPPSDPTEQARRTAAGAVAVRIPLHHQASVKFAVAVSRSRTRAAIPCQLARTRRIAKICT